MVWVKAKVDPKLYIKVPGTIIRNWGHDFIVQVDGSLCMQMHPDFVAAEVKAGRIEVMEKAPPGHDKNVADKITIVKQDTPPPGYTLDIGNYYGAGDLNKLIDGISKFRKNQIISFIEERFPEEQVDSALKKSDMVDKLRSLIDSALLQFEDEDE